MHRKALFILIVLATLTVGGCQLDPVPPSWTVLVYMAADDGRADLTNAALADITAMENAASASHVDVVVQIGRPGGDTKRYRIYDGGRELLDDLGDVDMSSEAALEDFLSWAAASYPADRTALILWGHGDGWDQDLRDPGLISPQGMFTDGSSAIVLSNYRIRRAIENSGIRLAVLGFDGCNMGTLEALYEFHQLAPVLIASEEEIPLNGWSYYGLLNELVGRDAVNAQDFGQIAVETYAQLYDNPQASDGDRTTLTAFDSRRIPAIAEAVDALADRLAAALSAGGAARSNTVNAIAQARAATVPVIQAGYTYVDLIDFSRLLSKQMTVDTAALESSLSLARLAHYTHRSRTLPDGKPMIHGLSIVFYDLTDTFGRNAYNPHYAPYDAGTQTGNPAAFLNSYGWSQFLNAYYHASGQLPLPTGP